MEGIKHRIVAVNGINMHIAEKGDGPVVLFLHGFPDIWYTWRHQINGLAARGYRAVAPDLRGYGDTDAPPSKDAYTIFHIVGDLIALIDALSLPQVFLVGHDWGALAAWYFCLFRPDRIKALVNLSVCFRPRNPKRKPIETLRAVLGKDYYMCRFQDDEVYHGVDGRKVNLVNQVSVIGTAITGHFSIMPEPGVAESEFAMIDMGTLIKKFLTLRNPGPLIVPKGALAESPPEPITLPPWLCQEDIDYYVSKFSKSGFTGGLNYYRNIDPNWELTAPWTGVQVKVPVKFIVGDLDLTYTTLGAKDYIHNGSFKRDVPFLQDVVVMEGVGHFLNQERSDEVTDHIYDFFQKF